MTKIHSIFNFLSKNQKLLFLILTISIGIFIFMPYSNFQPVIAQGDHGRDLYVAQATLQGSAPYQDYWWVYGPAMPYFYATVFKIFGISIQNILMAKIFLTLACGVLFYLTICLFASPLMGLASTIWFWSFRPSFFHTYNHIGVILFSILCMFFIAKYIQHSKKEYVYASLLSVLIIFLIKANMGLFYLLSALLSFLMIDFVKEKKIAHKKLYTISFFAILAISTFTYWILTKDLPGYALKQCFPYFPGYDQTQANIQSSLTMLILFIKQSILKSHITIIFSIIAILCFLRSAQTMIKNTNKQETKKYFLFFLSLALFIFSGLHEFMISSISYRIFWINPFQMLFIFTAIGYATKNLKTIIKIFLYIVFITVALTSSVKQHNVISLYKNNNHLFKFNKTEVYVQNPPIWLNTITATSHYLKNNLKNNETFLALPYDCIYYFLTNKKSPTRELIFFDYLNIPQSQEKQIISNLKKNHVRFIVLSSRRDSHESGLGTFGKTYCPLLKEYIDKNFIVVKTFGDWNAEPGWAWPHGVRILKRQR